MIGLGEASRLSGIHRRTLVGMIARGELRAERIANAWTVREADIRRLVPRWRGRPMGPTRTPPARP